jgi:cobalt-zinc-cadmium efflux system protein
MGPHDHRETYSGSARAWLQFAVAATLALVVVEFVTGSMAHSLSLISDAWHNLSDLPSLGFALLALYLERLPSNPRRTFGYQRAGVVAAFVNALLLLVVAAGICYSGYRRIGHPLAISSHVMMDVGAFGLVLHCAITYGLVHGRSDLNIRAIFIHNLGDALSNIAIIVGAWIIRLTGQSLVDPLLALLIAGMILWSAIGVVGDSLNILLESLPEGMTVREVARVMLCVEGVRDVHDIHIWSLNNRSHAMACHVRILDMPTSETELIAARLREVLAHEFGITHCTIQFEHTHLPGDFHKYMPEPAPRA